MRLLIDSESGTCLGPDVWDSVGPERGRLAAQGGFVDPNCLMIDKLAVGANLGRWAEVGDGKILDADRWFFKGLMGLPFGSTDEATVEYKVRPTNILRLLANEANAANATSP
jgi:hypothetical protein